MLYKLLHISKAPLFVLPPLQSLQTVVSLALFSYALRSSPVFKNSMNKVMTNILSKTMTYLSLGYFLFYFSQIPLFLSNSPSMVSLLSCSCLSTLTILMLCKTFFKYFSKFIFLTSFLIFPPFCMMLLLTLRNHARSTNFLPSTTINKIVTSYFLLLLKSCLNTVSLVFKKATEVNDASAKVLSHSPHCCSASPDQRCSFRFGGFYFLRLAL